MAEEGEGRGWNAGSVLEAPFDIHSYPYTYCYCPCEPLLRETVLLRTLDAQIIHLQIE